MSDGGDAELERATSDVATAQPFINPLHRLIEKDCGSIGGMGVRRPPTEAQLALEHLIERREVDSLLGIFLSGSETTSVGKLYAFLGLRALSSGAQSTGGARAIIVALRELSSNEELRTSLCEPLKTNSGCILRSTTCVAEMQVDMGVLDELPARVLSTALPAATATTDGGWDAISGFDDTSFDAVEAAIMSEPGAWRVTDLCEMPFLESPEACAAFLRDLGVDEAHVALAPELCVMRERALVLRRMVESVKEFLGVGGEKAAAAN